MERGEERGEERESGGAGAHELLSSKREWGNTNEKLTFVAQSKDFAILNTAGLSGLRTRAFESKM